MMEDGVDLPDHVKNAPVLSLGLALYYNAFNDLSSCRVSGMALGPIPWTAILAYCDEYNLHGEQREDMFFHIGELDAVFRAESEKQSKKKKPQAK